MSSVGTLIVGKYRLTRVLGQGGMGTVYAAENTSTGKRVAVKTLRPDLAQNKDIIARFFQEARSATQIEHPNIVDVYDLDIDSVTGVAYIVQELLRGHSLKQHEDAQPDRRLHPSEALDVIVPIMGALVAAHRRGIIHRDIKPENIFLSRSVSGMMVPKLIDFGISKVMNADKPVDYRTQGGIPFGTPAYMSPEQTLGESTIDGQADVWSIGVVLYEALTGRLPFEASNQNALVVKITTEDPTAIETFVPDIPADLAAVVRRSILRDRDERFASMKAFLAALLECESYMGPGMASGMYEVAQKLPSGRHVAVRTSAAPPVVIHAASDEPSQPGEPPPAAPSPVAPSPATASHPEHEFHDEVTTERPAVGERDSDQDTTTLKFSRSSLQAPLFTPPSGLPPAGAFASASVIPPEVVGAPIPSQTQVAWAGGGDNGRGGRIALVVLVALAVGVAAFSAVRFQSALWAAFQGDPPRPRPASRVPRVPLGSRERHDASVLMAPTPSVEDAGAGLAPADASRVADDVGVVMREDAAAVVASAHADAGPSTRPGRARHRRPPRRREPLPPDP